MNVQWNLDYHADPQVNWTLDYSTNVQFCFGCEYPYNLQDGGVRIYLTDC